MISFESLLSDMQHCLVKPDEHVLVLIGAVWTIDGGVIAADAAAATADDDDGAADEEGEVNPPRKWSNPFNIDGVADARA